MCFFLSVCVEMGCVEACFVCNEDKFLWMSLGFTQQSLNDGATRLSRVHRAYLDLVLRRLEMNQQSIRVEVCLCLSTGLGIDLKTPVMMSLEEKFLEDGNNYLCARQLAGIDIRQPCFILGYMVLFMSQTDESGMSINPELCRPPSKTDAQARAARKACRQCLCDQYAEDNGNVTCPVTRSWCGVRPKGGKQADTLLRVSDTFASQAASGRATSRSCPQSANLG